jgi:hypothetical protein
MKKTYTIIIIVVLACSAFPDFRSLANETDQVQQESSGNTDTQTQNIFKNLGNGRLQVGNIIIDEGKKEAIIPGRLNMLDGPIEFIACTKGGMKAYESILEMDTDAKSFNLSMILLGLDPKKGKAAAYHFDPNPPEGDAVDIFIQWETVDGQKVIKAQELIYNMNTNKTFPADDWIYTGSVFLEDGRYLAEEAGVLIGFVHDPASVIESHFSGKFPAFGSYVVNKNYFNEVGMNIQMIIKPLEVDKEKKQETGEQDTKANLDTD